MKNKISALMDGELDSMDAADTIAQVKKTEELRNEWSIYHLIGDTLRQPEISSLNIASGVRQKLAIEPTILLTPEFPKEHKGKVFAFAVAASVVTAVAAVVWMGGQTMNQPLDLFADKAVLQTAAQSAEPTTAIPVLAQKEKLIVDKPAPLPTVQAESAVIPIPAPIQLNDYLFAHGEFSPRTAIRGVSPYMRTVADPYKKPINR